MSSIRDPRKLSKSYIEQREARRAGREKKPQSEFEKQLLSNIERDIRADIRAACPIVRRSGARGDNLKSEASTALVAVLAAKFAILRTILLSLHSLQSISV